MKMFQKNSKPLFVILAFSLMFFNLSSVFAEEKKEAVQQKYVSIDFNDVDIRVFIKFISELTNENFIIDSRVKGNVNIISPGKITIKEAYKVFESVLEVHGFTAIKAGEISKVIPISQARSKNVETRLKSILGVAEDKIVTQLIPLEYADTNAIKKLFSPLVSKGSVILAYTPTNTLIITDVYSNIKRLIKIINTLDVKDVGRQISVIPVEHADAVKLEKILNTLFRAKTSKEKKITPDQMTKLIADQRTNTIIILANEFETDKIKEFIKILDKQVPKSDAKIQVYYLENAKAEELATVLQSLSGKASKSPAKGKKIAPVVSEKVKITAHKATNSLIIMADKEDYQVLEAIIKKLDIPRPMVYIEALIMEIRDTDDFELGVEWIAGASIGSINAKDAGGYSGFTKESSTSGIPALPTIDNGVLNVPGGFALGVMAEALSIGGITFPNLGAAIRAMQSNEKVEILATPQIMTLDNEESYISVGENIPYKTTTGINSSEVSYENFEYKDVGVILKITPQISQGRFVRLNIYQKVEKVASTENNTPTTLKRIAETTVVVKDAATVVIGGLIGEDLNTTDYQVPCLGDIPFAGNLFKSTSRKGIKTNLYIFITPHIIENPAEAEKIYQKKYNDISRVKGKTIKLYKGSEKE